MALGMAHHRKQSAARTQSILYGQKYRDTPVFQGLGFQIPFSSSEG